jgi:hypothetical protein
MLTPAAGLISGDRDGFGMSDITSDSASIMPLVPIQFTPGINREGTAYSNKGGWYSCDKVRFRQGHPEKIGGWQQVISSQFLGICRALFAWSDNSGAPHLAVGTNLKYYVVNGGSQVDVTPIIRTVTLGSNPITTSNGSSIVTIHDVANGASVNDFVIFSGATGFNGISAASFNQELQVVSVVDNDDYTVNVGQNATSSGSGGGSSVQAQYELSTGLVSDIFGFGWGAGPWNGSQGWGQASSSSVQGSQMRLWSQANFGQDLVFNPRNGAMYYWSASSQNNRAVALTSLSGASDVPTVAASVFVSWQTEQVFAFGTNPIGSSTQQALWIRWSDQGNAAMWTPLPTNAAGGFGLSSGSRIVTVTQTHQEIIVFTDTSMFSLQYIGYPLYWGVQPIVNGITIVGPNSKVVVDDVVYWIGLGKFYIYDGHARELPCSIKDYVFLNANFSQPEKVYAGANISFNEIWWVYQSVNGTEVDSYIIYNYAENLWSYGTLTRTAWIDRGLFQYPIACGSDGYLYYHESGYDDGSTNPPSPITASITTSPFEIDQSGHHFIFANRLVPDVTFRSSPGHQGNQPSVNFTFTPQDYPGAAYSSTTSTSNIMRSTTVPVEEFTDQAWLRLRGRSLVMQVQSNTLGTAWRLGTPRLEIRPDGRR